MGCNCSRALETKADGSNYPQVNVFMIQDPFIKFEKQFPFHRMNVLNFLDSVSKIGKDTYSIEDLKFRLNTQIW